MDNGGQHIETATDEGASPIVENISGAQSFQGATPTHDPNKRLEAPQRPDHIPEKFWDAEKGALNSDALLKSYSELEKQFSSKGQESAEEKPEESSASEQTEEKPKEGAEEKPEEKPKGSEEAPEKKPEEGSEEVPAEAPLADAVESAKAVYKETGQLDEAARKPLIDAGISNDQIDLYLAGVKAQEAALRDAAMKAAGVKEFSEVEKAIAWATENWSEKKILAFNGQTGDVETIPLAMTALFKDYRSANPGEGSLTNINSGLSHGDTYKHMDEFARDLKKADDAGDPVARREAVAKLSRSQQAGSLKK